MSNSSHLFNLTTNTCLYYHQSCYLAFTLSISLNFLHHFSQSGSSSIEVHLSLLKLMSYMATPLISPIMTQVDCPSLSSLKSPCHNWPTALALSILQSPPRMFYLTFQTHNWNGYLCESLFNKWASLPPQYLKKCWALMMCKTMQSTTWHRKLHIEREGLNRHATIPLPVLQLLLLSAPRAPLQCCLQAATLNVHRHGLPKFILWRKVILMQRWQSMVVQCLA
jgi:hypothetical protein